MAASGESRPINLLCEHPENGIIVNDGAAFPLVGLGTYAAPPGVVEAAIVAALKAGYRHIDCAALYGNEAEIGTGLQQAFAEGIVKREDVWITSKLWLTETAPEHIEAALAKTLSDLQLDYLDLYMPHWPFFISHGQSEIPPPQGDRLGYDAAAYAKTWEKLEEIHATGKIKHLGVSNMSIAKLEKLLETAKVIPVTNQVECHPYLQRGQLLEWCAAHGITLTAYSPFGSPGYPRQEGDNAEAGFPLQDPTLAKIAEAKGKNVGQVIVRWLIQRGVSAIPKSGTPARIAGNFEVFDFELSAGEMAQIAALDKGEAGRVITGAVWIKGENPSREQIWDVAE